MLSRLHNLDVVPSDPILASDGRLVHSYESRYNARMSLSLHSLAQLKVGSGLTTLAHPLARQQLYGKNIPNYEATVRANLDTLDQEQQAGSENERFVAAYRGPHK